MESAFETLTHEEYMREALIEAEKALARGDRPIGAVIVQNGEIIARAGNCYTSEQNDLSHAELKALMACASHLHYSHGQNCTLYSTMEPCVMCLGAIVMANIRNVVFGAHDNFTGGRTVAGSVEYVKRHLDNYVGGILEEECVSILSHHPDMQWFRGNGYH